MEEEGWTKLEGASCLVPSRSAGTESRRRNALHGPPHRAPTLSAAAAGSPTPESGSGSCPLEYSASTSGRAIPAITGPIRAGGLELLRGEPGEQLSRGLSQTR